MEGAPAVPNAARQAIARPRFTRLSRGALIGLAADGQGRRGGQQARGSVHHEPAGARNDSLRNPYAGRKSTVGAGRGAASELSRSTGGVDERDGRPLEGAVPGGRDGHRGGRLSRPRGGRDGWTG